MGIVEDALGTSSVFSDRAKLDFNFVPPSLPHRDDELRTLTSLFRVVADQQGSATALITGSVGTGKTALSKKFCADFTDACRKRQINIESVHINCRKNGTEGLVLLEMLRHFDPGYPERGYSTQEMTRDLRKRMEKRACHLIVILDEADALIAKEGSDLVYALTRFDDDRAVPKATLSLILVSQYGDLPLRLDEAARSTFRRSNIVELAKYNEKQLRDIVAQRVELAFHKRVVNAEVVELIAEIAAEDGDARYAIELLDHAGRMADEERSETVDAEYVRAAKAHTRSFVTEAKLKLLSLHQLLVLKSVARKLGRSRSKTFLTTGEAEEAYALVAEEHGEKARGHTQFWKYSNELQTAGWIRVKEAPRTPTSGNTQYISLPDVPAKVLLEKLEAVLKAEQKTPRN